MKSVFAFSKNICLSPRATIREYLDFHLMTMYSVNADGLATQVQKNAVHYPALIPLGTDKDKSAIKETEIL